MNCDYIPSKLVERARTGPLAPYIDLYVSQLKQAGYVPAYARENLTVLAAFGRMLERSKLRVEDLNEDIVDRFVRKRYPKRRPPRQVRPTLRRLLAMVREMGVAPRLVAPPRVRRKAPQRVPSVPGERTGHIAFDRPPLEACWLTFPN